MAEMLVAAESLLACKAVLLEYRRLNPGFDVGMYRQRFVSTERAMLGLTFDFAVVGSRTDFRVMVAVIDRAESLGNKPVEIVGEENENIFTSIYTFGARDR